MYRRSCPPRAPDALEEGNSSAETGTSFQAMQAPSCPGWLAQRVRREEREMAGDLSWTGIPLFWDIIVGLGVSISR